MGELLLMFLAVVLRQGHPCLCCGLHWQDLLALCQHLQAMFASGPHTSRWRCSACHSFPKSCSVASAPQQITKLPLLLTCLKSVISSTALATSAGRWKVRSP